MRRLLPGALASGAVLHLGLQLHRYAVAGTAQRHHVESAWYVFAVVVLGLVSLRGLGTRPAQPAEEAAAARGVPLGIAFSVSVIASALLFLPALFIGLLSDDHVLVGMPVLSWGGWEFFRPLPLLVWSGVLPIAGPPGLHALNILLHGVNGGLVFALARAIVPGSPSTPVLAAALFVSSPLAVEAVAWCAGIFDTALVTWTLGYLLVLAADRTGRWSTLGALVCVVGALATKETAVALPLLGGLLALKRRVPLRAVLASGAVCAGYALVRAASGTIPLGDGSLRFLAKEIVRRAFGVLGEPWTATDLSALPILLAVVLPLGYALLIAGYALARDGNWRGLSAALWIIAGAMPLLGYFFVGADLSGSRYAYLPLVGWVLLLTEAAAGQATATARRVAATFLVGVIVTNLIGGHQRLGAWAEAASVRDMVVASAMERTRAGGCADALFAEPPDVHAGAYVFRNGLAEALAREGLKGATTPRDGIAPACRFVWRGQAFVPLPDGRDTADQGAAGSRQD